MMNPGSSAPKNKLLIWWDSLPPLSRLLAIALAAPLGVLNAWALSTIFNYFQSLFVVMLVASLLAFVLNYPVDWIVRKGFRRGPAAALVFLIALFFLLILGVTLVPLAITQAQQLVARLPEWFDSAQRQLMMLDSSFDERGLPISLDGLVVQINERLRAQLQTIAGKVLNLSLDLAVFTVSRVVEVLLTVISTFYLLQHGHEVWDGIVGWLPTQVQKPFSKTLRLSFQNYFIGQIILSTCMAFGLTSIFLLLKVPFGLLFGLTIGLMALVPFGGSVGITTVTFLVGLRDIGLAAQVLAISVVVQQIVENGIGPRVFGSVTGLNPFWIFLSILAGARVGGLLGVVVAVPTAVVLKEALEAARSTRQPCNNLQDATYRLSTPADPHLPPDTTPPSLLEAAPVDPREEIPAGNPLQ